MPVMFNSILQQEGINVAQVRLLRHQDNRTGTKRTPYEMWRDERSAFEEYQRVQSIKNRTKFELPFWASFVADPSGRTLFVGLYKVHRIGVGERDIPRPHMDGIDRAGMYDLYSLQLQDALRDLDGKLYIDWGLGTRSWVQRAENQNKIVSEIRLSFKEETFPGFSRFLRPLSEIQNLPG